MRAFVQAALLAAILLSGAAGLGGAAFGPSRAAAGDDVPAGGMEPRAIETILVRQGYSDVRNLRRRGGLWLADASARAGSAFARSSTPSRARSPGWRPWMASFWPRGPASRPTHECEPPEAMTPPVAAAPSPSPENRV